MVNEQTYLQNRWGLPRESTDAYIMLLGERAWLTVIDDLVGARTRVKDTVSDTWDMLLNDHRLGAKWTIITSNKTQDELLEQGTINIATWSRLGQMTGNATGGVHRRGQAAGGDGRVYIKGRGSVLSFLSRQRFHSTLYISMKS